MLPALPLRMLNGSFVPAEISPKSTTTSLAVIEMSPASAGPWVSVVIPLLKGPDLPMKPEPVKDIHGARPLLILGDSITTDHISPAGSIQKDSPAGEYLLQHQVRPHMFNVYGCRRGAHEVMMRGTFANIRIRNAVAPGTEGGVTKHYPSGQVMSIYEAATLERWNVVNRVLPDDELIEKGMRFAHRLASGPTKAHAVTKRVVRAYLEGGVEQADDEVPGLVGSLFDTDDLKGAVKSFLSEGPGKATFEGR